tara:strand:- start:5349 stop:6185 length:837 start_codon:yes stop_codon:yes gene_type:complete
MVIKPIKNTRAIPLLIFSLSPCIPFKRLSFSALTSLALILCIFLYSSLSLSSLPMTDTGPLAKALNYEARYHARIKGLNVKGIKTIKKTGDNRYQASWKAKALWLKVDEWSEFEMTKDNMIRPIKYHYQKKGFGKNERINLYFDWKNQRLIGETIKNKTVDKKQFSLTPGVQNKLTYQIQMQLDLISNSLTGSPPETLSYHIASDRGLEKYLFTRNNEASGHRKLDKKNLTAFSRQKKNRLVAIHFDQDIFFIPALIRQSKNDKTNDIHLSDWQLLIN